MIKGRATAEGTINRKEKFPELNYKELGRTGIFVSAAGFGAYRVDYRVQEHSDALQYAVEKGINLIDTSSNYSDGGSEILIGRVLSGMISSGILNREEIVVVTKGGYIQGSNYEKANFKKLQNEGYPEVVEYANNLWHCIHPDFLKDQIDMSLERMQLETIDVYLLHNPEYFLDSEAVKDMSPEEIQHTYYNRIRNAFEYLETEAAAGRIGMYGISSNTFTANNEDVIFTSLERCFETASSLGDTNNFKVIQFPVNLVERGAVLNKNQESGTRNILDFAFENGIGILTNRPLNAIQGKKLNRIADFEVNKEYVKMDEKDIENELDVLKKNEMNFLDSYVAQLKFDEKTEEAVKSFLTSGQVLKQNWKNFGSIENFNDVKKQFLIPRANFAFSAIVRSENVTEEMKEKLNVIALQINKLIGIIESIYGLQANIVHKKLTEKIDNYFDDQPDFVSRSLSQKSIMILSSLEQVSSVLVGMRQKKYVDDVTEAIKGNVENALLIMEELKV